MRRGSGACLIASSRTVGNPVFFGYSGVSGLRLGLCGPGVLLRFVLQLRLFSLRLRDEPYLRCVAM